MADSEARAKKLEEAEAARADAQLSEVDRSKKAAEKAEARATALAGQLNSERISNAVLAAAQAVGCSDTKLVLAALDRSAITVDDATGAVSGVDVALAALRKAHPVLFSPPVVPTASGGAGNPAGGPPVRPGGKYTAADIRRMSPSEFQKFDQQVRSGRIKLS